VDAWAGAVDSSAVGADAVGSQREPLGPATGSYVIGHVLSVQQIRAAPRHRCVERK
jgi:hypothetical protein